MPKWIIFLVLLSACHRTQYKPENSITLNISNSIVGSWELSTETGGFVGILDYAPGNGNTIAFFESGAFRQINVHSSVTLTGTYQIIKTNVQDGKDLLVRKYDSPTPTATDSLIISNNQLTLSRPPQCCDIPYSWTYNRTPDKN